MGVVVGEQAPLQHLVRAETGDMVLELSTGFRETTDDIPGLDAGHEVCGGEG